MPLAYARTQVVAPAVGATVGFDDESLAAYAREAVFPTAMGDVRFCVKGGWAQPRVLQVQFQEISGHNTSPLQKGSRHVVLSPAESSSGKLALPHSETFLAE
ncbi:hypothetical protein [Streptomyces xinghaiensis]|uniref:hypothetical protein n=1 Tax=Streptomyces xinghaiensis TaxID=1038928 RepID=UPI003419E079